ncbi:E3 ubiquitin-protein ligase KEG [Linum perenne]
MKVPCCSVCQNRYNEEERVPLLLQCGHGFCKECLSKMFSASQDTTLVCPRCRHVSVVGNSVHALRKNYAVLALLHSPSSAAMASNFDYTDDEDDDEDEGGNDEENEAERCSRGSHASSSGTCGRVIELGVHQEVKLVKKIGEGRRAGAETWSAVIGSSAVPGKCRHRVAVKKVEVGEGVEVDWVQAQLENLRRASMWCRNVCTFHGVVKVDGCLGLVMDKYCGSVQSEMQQNEGRLTLEQILRYGADIARGVAELHAAGVVCMNLKPSNLLLDPSGRAVVSDYGLASILKKPSCRKSKSECDSAKIHSCMDCIMLSPHYTAPEAWEPVKKSLNLFWDDAIGISAESDAWSFGCTLVEMCTGATPWAGLSAEEVYRAVVKARKLPPQYASVVGVGIPRELWKMVGECLQFKPSRRPTFNAMLAIFIRHLQELPRSPPASPDNDYVQKPGSNIVEPSPPSDLEVLPDNSTHLHRLVSEGNVIGVRDLLAKAASGNSGDSVYRLLEAQNADGQTALHLACRRGCAELVQAILEYREANVDVLDKDGDPPLVFALAAGSPECVHALIRSGANVRSRLREGFGPSVAHVCAYHGQPDCMRELLLAGADPNAVDDEGESVLHRALSKKYTDCAIAILENGGCRSMAFVNSKNLTPLHLSVATWSVAVVRRWVEVASPDDIAEAINIPSPVGTALCMAASSKKDHEIEGRQLVQILLEAGADPTSQDAPHGRTALHTASMANDVELVKIILDAGVDVNIRNMHNTIPLHVALARGAKSCVGILLNAGADCNIQDDEGDTAFHIAADAAKMIRENLEWLIVMLGNPIAAVEARNHRLVGKTLRDYLETLPREWISEDLMEALLKRGVHLSSTIYEVGDWVKFRRSLTTPANGWQAAKHKSVGFVQTVVDKDNLVVSFCTGEAHVLASEVWKVIPLDRGQHVRLKSDVKEPRFGWRGQLRDSIGTVLCVDDDGILRVGFPGASRGWKADPAEMERVEEFKVGDWVRIRPTLTTAKHGLGSERWVGPTCHLERVEKLVVGQKVRVKLCVKQPRFGWSGHSHGSVGTIAGIDADGKLRIYTPAGSKTWMLDPSEVEVVKEEEVGIGDWVRVRKTVSTPSHQWGEVNHKSIGVVHRMEDGEVWVSFCFMERLWICKAWEMEKIRAFEIGDKVRIREGLITPRWGWGMETHTSKGEVVGVDANGKLRIKFQWREGRPWIGDPADIVIDES